MLVANKKLVASAAVPASSANLGAGFDTFGLALGLYNYFYLSLKEGERIVTIKGEGSDSLPRTSENIVCRAIERVWQEVNFIASGYELTIENCIPLERGLGSSAAAIIGGLMVANILSGEKLSKQKLLELAIGIEGHSDNVSPALLGGITVALTEKKGSSYALSLLPPSQLKTAVVIPEYHLSTKKSRDVLPAVIPYEDAVFNVSRASFLLASLVTGHLEFLDVATEDRLHQPYRLNLVPGLKEAFTAGKKGGALAVTLSGSGPSILLLGDQSLQNAIDRVTDVLFQKGIRAYGMELAIDINGAQGKIEEVIV